MKILLVDDHRLFAEGMRSLLTQLHDDVAVTSCHDGNHALSLIDREETFDLILADLDMPGLNGFALLQSLRERQVSTPVVVISASCEKRDVEQALRTGALGFIPKYASSDVMLGGLRQVAAGRVFLPDELWAEVDLPVSQRGDAVVDTPIDSEIGERQLEVLQLMAQGLSNGQISNVLAISEATVKYHIGVLFRVLGVKNRTACINKAYQKALIKP